MKRRTVVIIATCLLIVITSLVIISVKSADARIVDCESWAKIKLCFDDDPDNDPDCCNGGTPKDEMSMPR